MSNKNTLINLLNEGNFTKAYESLSSELQEENEVEHLVLLHRIIKFWQNREEKLTKLVHPYEQALAYYNEWEAFESFMKENKINPSIPEVHAIHNFVFNKALNSFLDSRSQSRINDIDLLKKISICFRELGEYDNSIKTLQYAYRLNKDQLISLMLADVFYAKGQFSHAKILFKDTFFLENNIAFDTKYIVCDKINEIIENIKKDNYPEYLVFEWIPVYGYIEGFLNVKRELSENEFEKVSADLVKFEKLYYSKQELKPELEPKILKKCILMLEYYIYQVKDEIKKNQYLLKIHNLNESLAKQIELIL
jgi:tetratricopeptide (TPR) repeat protein